LAEVALGTIRPENVTVLLARWRTGSSEADQRLMDAVQAELRRLAASYLRRERPEHTLQPTALVNEAYVRLVDQRAVPWQNRAHFFGIAAQIMRRILVDHARKRRALKRDGPTGEAVPLSQVADPAGGENVDVLSLHEALSGLSALDARQAHIVELRYFGALTVEEIAVVANISPATVKRELTTAKLWLRHRMSAT
jgi:RNA polymerase sigma-70 factor, ECF subfamily